MQVGSRKFIPCAHVLIFTICNDGQALVAVNIVTFFNLKVIQMPIFCDPTITMINFHVATGCFNHSTCRRRSNPKIGCIHSNIHIPIGSKVYCAAHFIIMRTGRKTLGAIVKCVHGDPGFSLRPGPLEHIRRRSCAGIIWN